MNIHEYQAKKILTPYGINIPKGRIAYTVAEAKKAALEVLPGGPWMLKAQIQSGARNKGYFLEAPQNKKSGIRLVKSRRHIMAEAGEMLGNTLVTPQTGPKGKLVSKIYVEACQKVKKVFYAGLVIDRLNANVTLMVAETSEDNIEEIALTRPERILRETLDLQKGPTAHQIRKILDFLCLNSKSAKSLRSFIRGLHKAFMELDATMIEINPVGVMKNGELIALDAKISFDDNALFRHKDIQELKDDYEDEDRRLQAAKYNFEYNEFDGSVGIIVNGDGVALSAMDLLKRQNAEAACFLNVKGGVDKDKIASGIKIIMTNPRVEGILINIIGGFLRCNLIAEGILAAAAEVGLNVPLVVRFEGTNKDEAKDILEQSKLPLIIAENVNEAVEKLLQAMEESD